MKDKLIGRPQVAISNIAELTKGKCLYVLSIFIIKISDFQVSYTFSKQMF